LKKAGRIQIIPSNRYNPELDYIIYMVPGIIVVLTTLLGLLLSVLNIVREKEIGTAEQMNVTPIKKYQFIAGKLIPAWVLVMTVISIGFLIALSVFDVPFRGNMSIVYLTASVYLVGVLGLGLFISTQADTQQQSMHIIFFIFMVFMLLGGIFTPLESMPLWAQKSTLVNPIAYFGQIVRMVLLKGSGWGDLYLHIFALIVMAVIMVTAAVISYDKRAG
jgi:ABC-2 type transport system permease protein